MWLCPSLAEALDRADPAPHLGSTAERTLLVGLHVGQQQGHECRTADPGGGGWEGSWSVSQWVPQYTLLSTLLCLQRVISLVPSLWRLRLYQNWTLTGTPRMSCGCPVSWSSCSFGSAGLTPSRAPAVHRRGRCWGGPTQSPGSGPGWELSWSACHLSCTHTT